MFLGTFLTEHDCAGAAPPRGKALAALGGLRRQRALRATSFFSPATPGRRTYSRRLTAHGDKAPPDLYFMYEFRCGWSLGPLTRSCSPCRKSSLSPSTTPRSSSQHTLRGCRWYQVSRSLRQLCHRRNYVHGRAFDCRTSLGDVAQEQVSTAISIYRARHCRVVAVPSYKGRSLAAVSS